LSPDENSMKTIRFMSSNDLKDNIVQLLEEVAERAGYINLRHPEKEDLSLDIDLVKDDLRRLYRQFELLKNANGEASGSFGAPPEASPASPEDSSLATPAASPATPKAPPEAPSAQPEAPAVPPEAPAGPPETPGTPSETSAAQHEAPSPQSEAPSKQPGAPGAPQETPPSPPEETNRELEDQESGSEEPSTSQQPSGSPSAPPHSERPGNMATERPDETPASSDSRPGAQGSGKKKAVIDLLSEYAGRTIGDQYMEEDNSVHQRISNQKEDKSIGTRMQQKPIASLKEAIGVNEKFLFINELFKGNIQAYNEAISRLNEMDDAKAAFDYLNELSMVHSWDANRSASTIEKLADLVHRRHMSK